MDGDMMSRMMDMMRGMEFPATKQDIMDKIQSGDGDEEMMDMVQKLPDREYQDMDDLRDEMTGMM